MTLFLTVVSTAALYKWVECVDVLTNRALFFALQAMAERLAENAHDLWAKRKREELDSIGNSIHLWLRHTDCLSHCLQYIVDQCLQQTCLSHCLQYIVDQWLTHCHNVSNILWISDWHTVTMSPIYCGSVTPTHWLFITLSPGYCGSMTPVHCWSTTPTYCWLSL